MSRGLLAAWLGLAALWPAMAGAHARATSYSEWTLTPGGAEVSARITALELTRLQLHPRATPEYAAAAGAALARGLELWAGEAQCAPAQLRAHLGGDGWLRAHWQLRCASPDLRTIRTRLPGMVAPGHLHFARARLADGTLRERVLGARDPELPLPAQAPDSLPHYLALGVDHILSGWDHLAFVLGLLLLAGSLAEMALIATGFTLAHSLTLGAAALGLVQVRTGLVEALIGFTIVLVAVEIAWLRAGRPRWMPATLLVLLALLAWQLPAAAVAGLALFTACYFAQLARSARPARLRIAMALLFGLIHGFGFAAVLLELELPPAHLALALFGFNSGVELGQLLVIALAWPVLWIVSRREAARRWLDQGAAAGLAGLGAFWFVARSLG